MNSIAQACKSTTCPYCGVGCGVEARYEGASVSAIGGAKDHPANFGRLCVKGSALGETLGRDGRLLHPLVGGRRVSWETAIDEVAGGFLTTIREHGPGAVAFYLSGQLLTEDYYVANKLMKGFIGSGNVDTNSRLCMASAVVGYQRAFGADAVPCSYEDLELCDLLVLVGSNAAWTHPVLYQRMVAARQARPDLKVVVIDPRATASCDIADLHLALRPGSDGFLFNGLLKYLADGGYQDTAFVANHSEGVTAALQAVANCDLDNVLTATGLPRKDLLQFYSWFALTPRTISFYSQGVNQSATGSDKCNAIINCHLLTGRVGLPGAGPFSITGQPNAMGGREVGGLATQLASHMGFTPDNIDRVSRFWGSDNVARGPGLKAVDLFEAIAAGRIKAVWIMATNPVVSLPRSDRIREALKNCPLVVVSDCVARSDTLDCADILLPATPWGEKDGTVTNSERRISRQRALMPPAGEARPDWEILCDVARKMGFGDAFRFHSPRDVFVEHAALSGFENHGRRAFDISGLAGLTEAEYEALPPLQWPVNADHPQGTARLYADRRFHTGSGRACFVPVTASLPANPATVSHPLLLNTGRIRDQWHTMTRTGLVPRLLAHIEGPLLDMHPLDMAARSLEDGDLVRVESSQGSMVLPVRAVPGMNPGGVFAPMHWSDCFTGDGRVGKLIASNVDPFSGQPESKFAAVQVGAVPVAVWVLVFSERELPLEGFTYWHRVPVLGGCRYLLATAEAAAVERLQIELAREDGSAVLSFNDSQPGHNRYLVYRQDKLAAALFSSPSRFGLPDSDWVDALSRQTDAEHRWGLLSGKSLASDNRGRLICSCFEVGERQILAAIADGARDHQALGARLHCGTNCGSCIPELKQLLANPR